MKKWISLAFAAVLPFLLYAQKSKYFLTEIREADNHVGGMCRDVDGNIWLGIKANYVVELIKMDRHGQTLDKVNIFSGFTDNFISHIICDSEGMIVGCGNHQKEFGGKSFVFRYDPKQRKVLWSKELSSFSQFGTIAELPNKTYLVCGSSGLLSTGELLILNANDGSFIPSQARSYESILYKTFQIGVYHKGYYYVSGTDSDDNGSSSFLKASVAKYDPQAGNMVWSRRSPSDFSSTAIKGDFLPRDLIVDNDSLVVATIGSSDTSTKVNNIYLQKFDLDGNLIWTNRYNINIASARIVDEIVAVSDGYVCMGRLSIRTTGELKYFIFKTDKNGQLKWSKQVGKNWQDKQFTLHDSKGEILATNEGLYFLLATSFNGDVTYFFKTDQFGNIGNCDYLSPLIVETTVLQNAVNGKVAAVLSPSTSTFVTVASNTFPNVPLTFKLQCNVPDECSTQADVVVAVEQLFCGNNRRLALRVCNNGGKTYTPVARVSIYDANPLTGKANLLTTIPFKNNLTSGECFVNFENLDVFKGISTLYALVGALGNESTPISLANFPLVQDGDECNFDNNLLIIDLKKLTKPDLGADKAICSGKSIVLTPATAADSYLWQNGSQNQSLNTSSPGLYWVETVQCGFTGRDSVSISVSPTPTRTVNITFPKGGSVVIGGNTYTQPGSYPLTVPSKTGGCDSLITYILTAVDAKVCDAKTNGCIRFEALSTKLDAAGRKRYRYRITNNCSSELNWVAIQTPSGLNAVSPANNELFTEASSGRKYEVRNPNSSPFNSIRFRSQGGGPVAGQSDVFEFVLPNQANQGFVQATVRLQNGESYSVTFSVGNCPVESNKPGADERQASPETEGATNKAKIFPNPAHELLSIALPENWLLQSTQVEVLNLAGQVLQRSEAPAGQPLFALPLDAALSNGIYFLRLRNAAGADQSLRFAVQR